MLRIQPSSADGILILQSTWLKYCTNACNTGVGELYPPMWPGFNSQSHCQRWGKLEQHLKTTTNRKLDKSSINREKGMAILRDPAPTALKKNLKYLHKTLWETVRSTHKFFSLLQTHLHLKKELSVLLWSLVHDFRMKIVCLHGQRSLQIALFLPPWGFGNCR
jgi:hypothetical protein